jgi:L-fuconolactonase
MKLDSHQHFWRYNPIEFKWIGDNMKPLMKDFLPLDLKAELESVGFDGSIAVQARQSLEETIWLLELASKNEFIKGVVGWVDLCSKEVEIQLKRFASDDKFVGVRHVIHDEADDNFMNRQDFQNGISLLEKYKLTYDLLIFPKHLPLAAEFVQKFPNQKFVLDHIAKPNIKDKVCHPWGKNIKILAQQQNVSCKLSGMVTEADWKNWNFEDFRYYLDTVFEAFGEDRIMIGSDWPVCTTSSNYEKVLSIVFNFIKQFGPEIQNKILGENCYKFYLNNS